MASGIYHAAVATKSDGPDNTKVQASDWNAAHVLGGETSDYIIYSTAAANKIVHRKTPLVATNTGTFGPGAPSPITAASLQFSFNPGREGSKVFGYFLVSQYTGNGGATCTIDVLFENVVISSELLIGTIPLSGPALLIPFVGSSNESTVDVAARITTAGGVTIDIATITGFGMCIGALV